VKVTSSAAAATAMRSSPRGVIKFMGVELQTLAVKTFVLGFEIILPPTSSLHIPLALRKRLERDVKFLMRDFCET
jgi:hypothetical protein